MGPPPLALGLVLNQELYRRMQAKGMVGSFGVIEEEPVSEFPVEVRQVVEEQVLVVIHELFLEGAIEAFGVGVHFRRAGVRPPVRDAAFLQALLEVAQKLRAVVGEHEAWGGRQEMAQGVQRESRLAARRGGGGKGDGETGVRVDEGEQVAAEAGLEAHHGIAGEHLEWHMPDALGLAGFAGPGHGFGAAAGVQAAGGVPHLVGRSGDEAPKGGDTGQGEILLRTPGAQQDMQLGLAEVGIGGAQAPDLLAQRRWPHGLTATAGRAGAGGQGRGLPVGLGERLLPAIERAPADPEGLTGRCLAVTGKELQNGESVLSIFGCHLPTMPELR